MEGRKYQFHGKTGTKLYYLWDGIKSRCLNPKDKRYKNYGKRGISMQENWIHDFSLFYEYITSLPSYDRNNIGRKGLSLDRIKNNGNYEEKNLRWTTMVMQNRNQRVRKTSSTGFRGVSYFKRDDNFRARICINYKNTHLGYSATAKGAYQLRLDYIKKHGLQGF